MFAVTFADEVYLGAPAWAEIESGKGKTYDISGRTAVNATVLNTVRVA